MNRYEGLERRQHTRTRFDSPDRPRLKIGVQEFEVIDISAKGVRFVNDNAPYFFVPRYVEFVDELPHTPTGRVQKFKLRERGLTSATWDRVRAGVELSR